MNKNIIVIGAGVSNCATVTVFLKNHFTNVELIDAHIYTISFGNGLNGQW